MKLVTLHQADNRMTAANIALCFGPFLSPPNPTETDGDSPEANSIRFHIEIIKYLLDIWPADFSAGSDAVM